MPSVPSLPHVLSVPRLGAGVERLTDSSVATITGISIVQYFVAEIAEAYVCQSRTHLDDLAFALFVVNVVVPKFEIADSGCVVSRGAKIY